MPTAHLIHGFNVPDGGKGTLDKLNPYFEGLGFDIFEHDSKWKSGIFRDLLSVRFGNRKRAESLASTVQPGDILVGHSNGCAVINEACWILAMMNPKDRDRVKCVWFNPALDADSPIPPTISNFLVFHTPTDRVVQISKFLLWHRWGQMGRMGYQGLNGSKATNCPFEQLGLMNLGHSGVFDSQIRIKAVMDVVEAWLDDLEQTT